MSSDASSSSPTKKPEFNDDVSSTTTTGLLTPTIVKILAFSNMITVMELGRLAQTCRANHIVIDNDEDMWACVLKQMDYKIPKDVIATLGHKWLVKQVVSNKTPIFEILNKTPIFENLINSLPLPRLSSDDMMIIYEIGFSQNGEEKVSRGCITGNDMEPLLSEGKIDLPLVNPIVVGNVKPNGWNFVGAIWNKEDDINQFWVNAQLLRIPDKQSCCIFSDKTNLNCFSVRALNRLSRRMVRGDLPVRVEGHSRLLKNDSPLALRDSPVANKIKKLFEYDFFFGIRVIFDVTAEKKAEMIKVVLQAKKRKTNPYQVFHFTYDEPLNNDVTISHILSELQCNE